MLLIDVSFFFQIEDLEKYVRQQEAVQKQLMEIDEWKKVVVDVDKGKKITQEHLLTIMRHQHLKIEEIHMLITSLGFSAVQLLKIPSNSNVSDGDAIPEHIIRVLNNLNLTLDQLLVYFKSRQFPQEELVKAIDLNRLDQEKIKIILSGLLSQTHLITYIQSLDIPAEQLLYLALINQCSYLT